MEIIHSNKQVHEVVNYVEVYKICEFFGCSTLCSFFDMNKVVLYDVISGNIRPEYLRYLCENLTTFLIKPEFAQVPMGTLISIFHQYNESFYFLELRIFIENPIRANPLSYHYLLSQIRFQNMSDDETIEFGNMLLSTNAVSRVFIQCLEKLKSQLIIETKTRDEYEGIVKRKWKTVVPPDFVDDIFKAASEGKLSSVMYLLANGTHVDLCFQN